MILALIATAFAAETTVNLSVPQTETQALCTNENIQVMGTVKVGKGTQTLKCGAPGGTKTCVLVDKDGKEVAKSSSVTIDGTHGWATFPSGYVYEKISW